MKNMERYYFTFGCGVNDAHSNCYTVIEAESCEKARDKMVERFGLKWAFQYTEKEWFINPAEDPNWRLKCMLHGEDPNRTEPISQAELYNIKEIK